MRPFRSRGTHRITALLLLPIALAACSGSDSGGNGGAGPDPATPSYFQGVYAGSAGSGSLLITIDPTGGLTGTLRTDSGQVAALSGAAAGSDLSMSGGGYSFTGVTTEGDFGKGSESGRYLLRARDSNAVAFCATFSGTDFSSNQPEAGRFAFLILKGNITGELARDGTGVFDEMTGLTPDPSSVKLQSSADVTTIFSAKGTIAGDTASAAGTYARGAALGTWSAVRCL